MNSRNIKIALTTTSILALSACSDTANPWNEEAGVFLSRSGLGQSVIQNRQYHNGERNFIVDLNNRFSNEVLTTVNFAFNSSRLDSDAVAILKVQANWIRQFPEVRFKVYGHTDLVGSASYNKRLGMRRARAAVNYLVSVVRVFRRADGFWLTEALVHLGFHIRRQLSGAASGVSGLSVS